MLYSLNIFHMFLYRNTLKGQKHFIINKYYTIESLKLNTRTLTLKNRKKNIAYGVILRKSHLKA